MKPQVKTQRTVLYKTNISSFFILILQLLTFVYVGLFCLLNFSFLKYKY